jgi:N-acetylmuramoyl-L-alanine amidase/putative methionine-R-sulfoxide reductase with GAF domain
MATTTTNPGIAGMAPSSGPRRQNRPQERGGVFSAQHFLPVDAPHSASQSDALQALLAFSALHEQIRRRKALAPKASSRGIFEAAPPAEFEATELFLLDEVLQLVAERAIAITGADGLAIALAENNEIVLRAAAGVVRPDIGARIDRDSAFSGACFRTAQVINCDDTETDPRVNLQACRRLGARSMIAVPLCGRRRVIGLLEAFSVEPFGFNDTDVGSLTLLAELVVGALKPEDEDRFAQSAQAAATKLETPPEPKPEVAPAPKADAPPAAVTKTIFHAPIAVPSPIAAPVLPSLATHTVATPAVAAAPASAPVKPLPAVATPVAATSAKPAEIEIVPTPSAEITDVPTAQEKASESAAEASIEPELTFGLAPERASRRGMMLVLLVCIVVATMIAGGVWWKMKTTQLGGAMVTEKPASPSFSQPAAPAPKDLTTAPVPSVPNADGTTAAQSNPDAIDNADDSDSSPASAQEMAKFPRVTGIRHWSSADSSTIVLDLEDQVQYEEHQISNPNRFYYDLRDTQLAADLAGKSIDIGDGFLSRIRIAQPTAGMTRIVLEMKSGSTAHPAVSLEPNPYRLVIEVHKPGAQPKGAVNLFPNSPEAEKSKLAIVIPPPTKEDLQLRARVPKMRIVVDAGHGGWDLGTVGRRGLLEKDLVLEIAQRLGKLLQSRLGAEVILTRDDDNYIPLDQRAEIANEAQADLFVSVHANYSDLPSARGVETYYTNFFSAPGSRAELKDVSTAATASTKNAPTLSAADLHERIEQSRRLAASVQRSLFGTLSAQNPGLRDRGIKEAGFVVLTESAMPGILAEVSFVSSPTDEQKLRSDGYREEIAEALYKGIARYAATSKNVKIASAGK